MGSSLGAGAEAQMTCDHTRRLSSILKAQTPQPQPQRAFQPLFRDEQSMILKLSATGWGWGEEGNPRDHSQPLPLPSQLFAAEVIRSAIIEHLRCANSR